MMEKSGVLAEVTINKFNYRLSLQFKLIDEWVQDFIYQILLNEATVIISGQGPLFGAFGGRRGRAIPL